MLDATQMATRIVDELETASELGGQETTYTLTVNTAVDDTDYVFQFDFGGSAVVFTLDSGTGATTSSIATLIKNAITNDTDNTAVGVIPNIATASVLSAVVTIVSKEPGLDFDMSETDGNMTLSAKSQAVDPADKTDIVNRMKHTTGEVVGSTVTPTALSSDVDDYAPTLLDEASHIRLESSTTPRTIGGIVSNHFTLFLTNIGATHNVILEDESTSGSSAANRFALGGANNTVAPGVTRLLLYDSAVSRWRVIS